MDEWKQVDHVQLGVPPGAEARARAERFYGDVLGLDPLDKPDSIEGTDSFWFGSGGVEVHLGPETDDGEPSRRHPAFEVADLAGLRERLETEGIEIRSEPDIPGRTRFSFRDPFDNRIELVEYDD